MSPSYACVILCPSQEPHGVLDELYAPSCLYHLYASVPQHPSSAAKTPAVGASTTADVALFEAWAMAELHALQPGEMVAEREKLGTLATAEPVVSQVWAMLELEVF